MALRRRRIAIVRRLPTIRAILIDEAIVADMVNVSVGVARVDVILDGPLDMRHPGDRDLVEEIAGVLDVGDEPAAVDPFCASEAEGLAVGEGRGEDSGVVLGFDSGVAVDTRDSGVAFGSRMIGPAQVLASVVV